MPLVLAILIDVCRYIIMVLTCFSLMANDFEHLLVLLGHLCILLAALSFQIGFKRWLHTSLTERQTPQRRTRPARQGLAPSFKCICPHSAMAKPTSKQQARHCASPLQGVSPTPGCHPIGLCITGLGSASERASLFSWSQGPSLTPPAPGLFYPL